MSLCSDVNDAVADLLAFREIIIGTIREVDRNNVFNSLQLISRNLLGIDIDLRIRKRFQLAGE